MGLKVWHFKNWNQLFKKNPTKSSQYKLPKTLFYPRLDFLLLDIIYGPGPGWPVREAAKKCFI